MQTLGFEGCSLQSLQASGRAKLSTQWNTLLLSWSFCQWPYIGHVRPLPAVSALLDKSITLQELCALLLSFAWLCAGKNALARAEATLKLALEWLTVPIFVIALQLPQGAVLYWLTSSSLTLMQVLILITLLGYAWGALSTSEHVWIPLVLSAASPSAHFTYLPRTDQQTAT